MSNVKGYRPSKKCTTYIKKMISQKIWKVGEQIPSLQRIAHALDISYPTVRKVVHSFEKDGIFSNWGTLGFYLVRPTKRISKSKTYLNNLESYLTAFTMIQDGAIKIFPWLIKYENISGKVTGLNEVNGTVITTNMENILEISHSLISLDLILSIKNLVKFEEHKIKFDNQRKILPLAKVILKHKKDFGIDEQPNLHRQL